MNSGIDKLALEDNTEQNEFLNSMQIKMTENGSLSKERNLQIVDIITDQGNKAVAI